MVDKRLGNDLEAGATRVSSMLQHGSVARSTTPKRPWTLQL